MICQNCGKENDVSIYDLSYLCSECGTEMVNYQPVKKKRSIRKILVVVFALVLVFGVAAYGKMQSNPLNRLAMGYARTMNSNKIEAKTTISYESDDTVFDEIKIVNQMTAYPKNLDVYMNMQLYYKDNKAGSIKGSIQDGIGYLSSDELMKEDFLYYKIEDYEDFINDYQIILGIYKKLSSKGVKWTKYTEAMNEAFGRDLKKDFNTITMKIDTDTFVDAILAFVEVAKKDDDLKVWAKENLTIILEELEDHKDDFESIDIDEDFLKDFDDAYDEFIDGFEDMEDELKDQLEYSISGMNMITDIEVIYELSVFNRIKSVTYKYSVYDFKIYIKTELDDGAKKETYSLKDGLDAKDTEELEEYLSGDLAEHLADYQKENETFKELMKDLEKEGLSNAGLYDLFQRFDSTLDDL